MPRPEWLFDDSSIPDPSGRGEAAVHFVNLLQLTEGKFAGQRNWLQPWQERLVRRIYGDVTEGGRRRIRTVFCNNLAELYVDTGRYGEAEPLYERALGITETAHGPDHPLLALRVNNLAGLYVTTWRYAEAEPLYERAIATLEARLGPDHPNTKTARANLKALKNASTKQGAVAQR
jgi:tetratricopeptide (TPR) repeat protein